MPYLPYEEPSITTILSLTSLLILLNVTRYILDRLLYCGIIAEILIGIIWGLPVGGTAWLSAGMQETIQAFGYLGLIGLVYEGGLSTDLDLLHKNAGMSISVATVGLIMPIALSFLLLLFPFSSSSGTSYPTPLAAFSAGASLCSTSLGTTFAILSSASMQQTRIGTVLVGAAMMDDVVGLVMVNIVTTLGAGGMGSWSIARPIVASFGLLLIVLAISPYLLKPCWLFLARQLNPVESGDERTSNSKSSFQRIAVRVVSGVPHLSFLLCTAVLVVFVTIAAFIDASILFAAFIAGGMVSYLWNSQHKQEVARDDRPFDAQMHMYERYYKSSMEYILVPFFFVSIGFSIPITDMFSGQVVWKGIVYSILMIIAKGTVSLVIYSDYLIKVWHSRSKTWASPRNTNIPLRSIRYPQTDNSTQESVSIPHERRKAPHADAMLVGFAMIARGEIGFLITSLSQSSGTLTLKGSSSGGGESIFLVIIWAVVLCTITGPVAVGIIVRRQRRQQIETQDLAQIHDYCR
ncbi:Sodium/hydrogen exchanger [Mollisia scopiformis]|uniref:Sodium/hydrogen exchanger n=1 Tax=Mollisia scopiformis TaxID=149040 RepID=A0A194XXP0_MOLSC|nr:Sodium/hydrogen exchanger [Mollisia scopiformis]KUJ24597.1 Sodium/hydrogen exchanger [Mollisia scopiformis]